MSLEEFQESPARVPGGLRDGLGGTSRQLRDPSEDPGRVPGGAEEAMSDLSLRFPILGGFRTL